MLNFILAFYPLSIVFLSRLSLQHSYVVMTGVQIRRTHTGDGYVYSHTSVRYI